MFNDDDFKQKYKLSEESIDVNSELKTKLIEQAKKIENDSLHQNKKPYLFKNNNLIFKITALVAGLALCLYSIPKINSSYFNRLNNTPKSTEYPTPTTTEEKENELPVVSDDKTSATFDPKPSAKPKPKESNLKNVEDFKNEIQINSINEINDEYEFEKIPEINISQQEDNDVSSLETVYDSISDKNNNDEISDSKTYKMEYNTDAPDSLLDNENNTITNPSLDSKSRQISEFNTNTAKNIDSNAYYNLITDNQGLLAGWKKEIEAYSNADEQINSYYNIFKETVDEYNANANAFYLNYCDNDNAIDNSGIQEDYDKLMSQFSDCQNYYLTANEYIKISLLNNEEN